MILVVVTQGLANNLGTGWDGGVDGRWMVVGWWGGWEMDGGWMVVGGRWMVVGWWGGWEMDGGWMVGWMGDGWWLDGGGWWLDGGLMGGGWIVG